MISIYKDKDMKVVTRGAYEQFYKPLGYNIILESTQEKKVESKKDNIEIVSKQKRSSSENKKNKNEATKN